MTSHPAMTSSSNGGGWGVGQVLARSVTSPSCPGWDGQLCRTGAQEELIHCSKISEMSKVEALKNKEYCLHLDRLFYFITVNTASNNMF